MIWYLVGAGLLSFSAILAMRLRKLGGAYLPASRRPFALAEAVSSIGWIAMFVAGFFVASWWAPIVACVGGAFAAHMVPTKVLGSGPGLTILGTIAGAIASGAAFTG